MNATPRPQGPGFVEIQNTMLFATVGQKERDVGLQFRCPKHLPTSDSH